MSVVDRLESLRNHTAERSLVAAVLVRGDVELLERVPESHFSSPRAAAMWRALSRLVSAGRTIDVVSVWQELGPDQHLAGSIEDVGQLADQWELAANASMHADVVTELYQRRELARAAARAAALAADHTVSVSDAADAMIQAAGEVGRTHTDGDTLSYREIARLTYADQQARARREPGSPSSRVPFGIQSLDDLTGGVGVGEMHILGARPKMGKSALAFSMMHRLAEQANPCLGVSMEMGEQLLGRRAIADVGRIDGERLLNPDPSVLPDVLRACTKLEQLPIHVHVRRATIDRIESVVRRWRATHARGHASPFVVVDYLQLTDTGPLRGMSREQQVSEISRRLRAIAGECQVAMLVLAQLNRGVEAREDKTPRPSDLRDSGSLEQDADKILMLWRPHVYDPSVHPSVAKIAVTQREGASSDVVTCRFEGQFSRFADAFDEDRPFL